MKMIKSSHFAAIASVPFIAVLKFSRLAACAWSKIVAHYVERQIECRCDWKKDTTNDAVIVHDPSESCL